MGMFDFLKKKTEELPLPPPPNPEMQSMMRGDFEPIRPPQDLHFEEPIQEIQEMPEMKEEISAPIEIPELTAEEKEAIYDTVEEPVRIKPGPAFVAVEDYKTIINDTNIIRSKLMAAETFVKNLSDLKNEEEKSFEKWRKQLEDVEKKLTYVDQLIAEAQR